MKKLLFENERLIDSETSHITLDVDVSELNYVNEFFKEHDLGQLNHTLLYEVLDDSTKVISRIIASRIPDIDPITKLKCSKSKILEGIELPRIDPNRISRLKLFVNKGYDMFFDFDGEVTLNETRLQTYLNKHRMFTDDQDIINVYDELNELAERLNSLNEKLNIVSLNSQTFGASNIFFDKLSKAYRISENGLQLTQQGFQELAVRNMKTTKVN